MKKGLLLIVLIAIALVAGCTLFQPNPPLNVSIFAKYAHPARQLGGFPVSLNVTGGTGKYTVDWGDGTVGDSLSHLYTAPIKANYTITVTSGGSVKSFDITIPNKPPVIAPPKIEQAWQWQYLAWQDRATIDFNYQEQVVDCPKRTVYSWGVWDPDNDSVTLVIHVYTDGVEDTLFTLQDKPVNGPVPVGKYEWWPGWAENEVPGYPIYIHAQSQGEALLKAVIEVTATDEWGATSHATFKYDVKRFRCQSE